MKLLSPLDAIFDGLNTFMFSSNFIDSRRNNAAESIGSDFDPTNNLLAIIDVLEVFIAIRIQLKLDCSCLRTLYLRTACMLDFINSSAHYFVKKKLLLVIKQCILCQFGENFAERSSCVLPQQHTNFQSDLLAVSNTVLQVLVSNWLEQVPVSPKACLFGGNEILGDEDSNCGPDLVMLRTVSLIVVKALEIKVQNWSFEGENKEDLNVQLQTCIHQLMMFIRTHLKSPAHSKRLIHSCAWVSLVFLEQDDDMVEAARALLNIYIHSVRFFDAYHGERGVNSLNAHESCFNPHCIFLLLLNNLTFDHCVLLDFLISAETCFLEYFVRYLRLLREEWQCFLCICRQFDEAELICPAVANEDSKHSDGEKQERTIAGTEGSKGYPWEHVPQAVLNLSACHILTPEEEQRKDKDTADSSKCGILINSSKFCLGGQSQGLVDYANSEDSDSESVEVPEFNIYSQEANPINNSKITKLASVNTIKDSEKNNCNLDTRDPGNLSLDYCDEKDTNMCASSGTVFNKSVTCLIELKKTIARLQGRNLFPYNAIALLRLLFQIETLSATTLHE
uniref:Uncharacterized protein n=2 Tax=Callorhinchus milii TaxID=7868 RepID=A0A4W3H4J3_CALMI